MNRASSSPLGHPSPGQRVHSAKTSANHRQALSNLSRPISRPGLRRVAKTVPRLQHGSDDRKEESFSLVDNTQPNSIPNLFVQISQHSSLDRDQYLHYLSSLSTRSYVSSVPPHEDSGLGESSSDPEDLGLSKSDHEVVVPDSQSLPGSSSYQPTTHTVQSFSTHSEPRNQQYHSCYSPHSSTHSSTLSDSFEPRYSDPTEDSSGVYVAESLENTIFSQRSASVSSHGSVQGFEASPKQGNPLTTFTGLGNCNRSSFRSETARASLGLNFQEEILDSQIPASTESGSQVRAFLQTYHLPVPVCEPYNVHHQRLRHGHSFNPC